MEQSRDLAFLHVAYTTLLRVSELGHLRVRHLSHARWPNLSRCGRDQKLVMTGGLIKALGDLLLHRLT